VAASTGRYRWGTALAALLSWMCLLTLGSGTAAVYTAADDCTCLLACMPVGLLAVHTQVPGSTWIAYDVVGVLCPLHATVFYMAWCHVQTSSIYLWRLALQRLAVCLTPAGDVLLVVSSSWCSYHVTPLSTLCR
jgi:hypothetical protein